MSISYTRSRQYLSQIQTMETCGLHLMIRVTCPTHFQERKYICCTLPEYHVSLASMKDWRRYVYLPRCKTRSLYPFLLGSPSLTLFIAEKSCDYNVICIPHGFYYLKQTGQIFLRTISFHMWSFCCVVFHFCIFRTMLWPNCTTWLSYNSVKTLQRFNEKH